MKRLLGLLFLGLLAAACGSDKDLDSGGDTGIAQPSWSAEQRSRAAGQQHLFPFSAAGSWRAWSDAAWCIVAPPSGEAGKRTLSVTTVANTTGGSRTATVTLQVTGRPAAERFVIVQRADDGDCSAVNEWMFDLMKENYLWNEPLAELESGLDFSDDYTAFLESVLQGVAACKDARGRDLNYDDGHWSDGVRQYFYSYVAGPGSTTRSAGDEVTETGLWRVQTLLSASMSGIVVYGVTPGTPAARAGLQRGMFITEVDGQSVSRSNYTRLTERLYYGPSVRLQPNRVVFEAGVPHLEPLPEVTLAAEKFTDPAVYRSAVVPVGDKRVGYLLYMGFESEQDDALLAAFEEFRGVDELVVDLRYNGGGSVRSSTLLATLIVGNAHHGDTYCRLTYNARRTAAGESGAYRIGDSRVPDGRGTYAPIAAALSSALELKRIYVICSGYTASASELLINGLRGFDVEVRLVGTRTNGKNVGMEGYVDRIVEGEAYTFMPVTFYSENARGFRDYSDGFVPDVIFDDGDYYPGDFATEQDALFALTAAWIRSGQKPRSVAGLRAFSASALPAPLLPAALSDAELRPSRHSCGSIVFADAAGSGAR